MRINIYVDARFKAPKDSQYIILATFEAQSIEHLSNISRKPIEHIPNIYRTFMEWLATLALLWVTLGLVWGHFGV